MTQPVTTTLSPDEWKQLCVLNAGQLDGYLRSIPALAEGGTSGLTDEHVALIEAHVQRGHSFLLAWRKSRVLTAQPQNAQVQEPASNGADTTAKRKGGWPLGKKRKAANAEAPKQ